MHARVLKEIVLTAIKVFAALPAAIAALAALREIAEKTGFNEGHPKSFERLSIAINYLLFILLDHWLPAILMSIFLGTIWALLVVEPKAAAQVAFDKRRGSRRPGA